MKLSIWRLAASKYFYLCVVHCQVEIFIVHRNFLLVGCIFNNFFPSVTHETFEYYPAHASHVAIYLIEFRAFSFAF